MSKPIQITIFFLFLGSLREITLELTKRLSRLQISVIPGQKLCPTCRVDISSRLEREENMNIENVDYVDNDDDDDES